MKYIKIQNNGLLDIRLVSLMGGTTKEGQSNKIGFFGTGLKYVLSYMIRNKLSLRIFIGGKEVSLASKTEDINGTNFNILYIDGQRTSITDKMGRDWKPWMIMRECWSNAIDEGGHLREITELAKGETDKTTFFFEMDINFSKVWNDWNKYFIDGFEPLFECQEFSIYPGTDTPRIYKQGVLIKELEGAKKSIFNYDYKYATLNELREMQNAPSAVVYSCLRNLKSRKMIEYFLENADEETFEGTMDYEWEFLGKFCAEWGETIGNAKIIHPKAVENIKSRGLDIDTAGTIIVAENLYKHLIKQFEGIGALRVADKTNEFYEIHDESLSLKLKSAMAILESCGYYMHPELQYIFGDFADKTTLAKVLLDKKEVLISVRLNTESMFKFVAMLIEENEHFNTGYSDHTRESKQHFINLFTKTMLEKHEVTL